MSNNNMRDSGIEWIGEIPAEWDVRKLGELVELRIGKTPQRNNNVYWKDGNIAWFSISDMNDGSVITSSKEKINKLALSICFKSGLVPAGTLIMSFKLTIGKVSILGCDGVYNEAIAGIIPISENVLKQYLFYALPCFAKMVVPTDAVKGNTLNSKKLNAMSIILPPLPEQRRIATYLDARVSRIDRLVDGLSRRVELLDEYKKSLISETVTKGIRQHENMKDSGIEWVGEIPAEWDVTLLGSVFHQHQHKNVGLIEQNLLSLSYGRIVRKNMKTNDGLKPGSYETYNIINADDIVCRFTDLQNDQRSLRNAISTERGIVTSAYLTIRSNDADGVDSRYVNYLLRDYDIKKVFYGLGAGVRQSLKWSEFRKLPLILPPLPEQREIAAFLDERVSVIDRLMDACRKQIDSLGEYKKSLISECVTGKRRITDADLEGVPVA